MPVHLLVAPAQAAVANNVVGVLAFAAVCGLRRVALVLQGAAASTLCIAAAGDGGAVTAAAVGTIVKSIQELAVVPTDTLQHIIQQCAQLASLTHAPHRHVIRHVEAGHTAACRVQQA